MQKRYLWIVAAIVVLAAGAVLFLSLGKKRALAQFEAGKKAFVEQNYSEATQLLEKTKKIYIPEQAKIERRVYLAQSYSALGKFSLAKKNWEKILVLGELKPTTRDKARLELAFLNKEKTPKLSQNVFQELAQNSQNPDVAAASLFQIGIEQENNGDLLAAQSTYKKISAQYPGSSSIDQTAIHLGKVNSALLFSKKMTPDSEIHVVKSGQSLALIAKKYNMPLALLIESNGLSSQTIHPGDRLKISTAHFSILIDKTQNTLTLKANGELFKIYSVGTGKERSTPIGEFKVTSKLVEPTWYHPDGGVIPFGDKENLLGTRWLGINSPGYGIHGTWEPESIGKQSSAGCVRMHNFDAEEIFKIVTIGTPVTIVE